MGWSDMAATLPMTRAGAARMPGCRAAIVAGRATAGHAARPAVAHAGEGHRRRARGERRWQFEPKWDGFRCIVFRDGDEIELGSRNERPLTRYFPELVAALLGRAAAAVRGRRGDRRAPPPTGSTSTLLGSGSTRPSPASTGWPSRPPPASWPSTCWPSATTTSPGAPLAERRARPRGRPSPRSAPGPPHPGTTDRATAEDWFVRFEGAGLDGVMAKPPTAPTCPTSGAS